MAKANKYQAGDLIEDLLLRSPLNPVSLFAGLINQAPSANKWSYASGSDIQEAKDLLRERAIGIQQFLNIDPRLTVGAAVGLLLGFLSMFNQGTWLGLIAQLSNYAVAGGVVFYATRLFVHQGSISARELHLAWGMLKTIPEQGHLRHQFHMLMGSSELCRRYHIRVLNHRHSVIALDVLIMANLAAQERKIMRDQSSRLAEI